MMNQIEAGQGRTIAAILVENGEPVEFDQPPAFHRLTRRSPRVYQEDNNMPILVLLIANRGDRASILRARASGISGPSPAPSRHGLMHVRLPMSQSIGPAPPCDSYFNVPAIISAAEVTNATAIHLAMASGREC